MFIKLARANETVAEVEFEYPPYRIDSERKRKRAGRVTKVTIKVPSFGGSVVCFEGKATCSPNENFSRLQGRRRALRKAFEQDVGHRVLSKSDRRAICQRVLSAFFPKKEDDLGILLDRLLLKDTSAEICELVAKLKRQIYGDAEEATGS